MMVISRLTLRAVAVGALLSGLTPAAVHAQTAVGTAFTYQGSLRGNNLAANGIYDMRFTLFPNESAPSLSAPTFCIDSVDVSDGLFTVLVDFGLRFDDDARWIEVAVRADSTPGNCLSGLYTTLTPRQRVTPTPVALVSADWTRSGTSLTNVDTTFVGINRSTRVTAAEFFGIQTPTTGHAYGGMYIRTDSDTGRPFYGYRVGPYQGWTYLDGEDGLWHVSLGNQNKLSVSHAGAVGIGTAPVGDAPGLSIVTDAFGGGSGPPAISIVHTGIGPGIKSTAAGGIGVHGVTPGISSAGVLGDNVQGEAVVGRASQDRDDGTGIGAVVGRTDAPLGYGVRGFGTQPGCIGVLGQAGISGGTGNAGRFENINAANFNAALVATTNSSIGRAADFTGPVRVTGNLNVSGTITKGAGAFMIDHPLDPTNKYLYHSFVESPDMKNIYDGVAQLDAAGRAFVSLPSWFEAVNGDFRYQLTAIGAPGPNLHIAQEISDGRFVIAGGAPGARVSWQVTGIRRDRYAQANRIPLEVEKPPEERGMFLHPELYGFGKEHGIGNEYLLNPTWSPELARKRPPLASEEGLVERP
jgi:hypothetical protein